MLIYIGADHQGFYLKEALKIFENQGYEVADAGNLEYNGLDDYPDFAKLVARAVSQDPLGPGTVICGSCRR